jgi:undecaprenyl-diphosphatase
MLDWLQTIDEKILFLINGQHSLFFDNFMWWVSGKYSWWPFYLLILVFLAVKQKWKAWLALVFLILVITISDQSSVHFFKNVFMRLRPTHNPEIKDLIVLVNDYRGGMYGFISSHASNTFAVAVFLRVMFKEYRLSLILLAWAVLVSYSRVYLRVHYPFDVIAGAAWGSLIGWGMYLLYKRIYGKLFELNSKA